MGKVDGINGVVAVNEFGTVRVGIKPGKPIIDFYLIEVILR